MRRLVIPALIALLPWACDGNGGGDSGGPPPNGGQGASTGNGGGAGNGGNGAQAGNGVGGSEDAPVYLSVTTNPLASNGVSPNASDQVTADLTAFALGVRAMHIVLRWDQFNQNDIPVLTQRVNAYSERPLQVVLELAVVDHRAGRRPGWLVGAAWNAPETVAALQAALDSLIGAVGSELDAVILGRGVDAYIEQHPAEAEALRALMHAGIERLSMLAPQLPNGVSLRFPSDVDGELATLGSMAVYSYLPGWGAATVPDDISATNDLDAMIEKAGDRPILLEAVGYTSALILESSMVEQRDMLAAFFAALEPRRAFFHYVNVFQLHDLQAAPCDAYALDQGLAPSDPLARYVCEAGLRDTQGEAKEAWTEMIEAAAALASP